MADIHRRAGDFGTLARVTYTIVDAEGTAVTSGSATLRIGGEADHTMVHQGAGVWTWDPASGDLDLAPGVYDIEVSASDVTLPSVKPDKLVVRARSAAPA